MQAGQRVLVEAGEPVRSVSRTSASSASVSEFLIVRFIQNLQNTGTGRVATATNSAPSRPATTTASTPVAHHQTRGRRAGGAVHPAGRHPAGRHPAGWHPAGRHPAGRHPAGCARPTSSRRRRPAREWRPGDRRRSVHTTGRALGAPPPGTDEITTERRRLGGSGRQEARDGVGRTATSRCRGCRRTGTGSCGSTPDGARPSFTSPRAAGSRGRSPSPAAAARLRR